MFEQLFGSKTRVKLLKLFYTNPNRSFYVREITRKVDEQINSVRRELSNLLGIGIIKSDANNNRLYYEVDQTYEYYTPLAMIFGGAPQPDAGVETDQKPVKKDKVQQASPEAPEHPLAQQLKTIGRVDVAILTGQFTRDDSAGVDVVIVGDINQAKAAKFMSELEKSESKELRYVILTTDNYKYRHQINDRFFGNVVDAKKQVIVNTLDIKI